MAPRRSTRQKAEPEAPAVNGVVTVTKTAAKVTKTTTARLPARPKTAAAKTTKNAKAAAPSKESTVEPEAKPLKRKADDEKEVNGIDEEDEEQSEATPEPARKRAKLRSTTPQVPAKPKAKGPLRRKGIKTEVNALRYTDPLKVFVCGEGSSGELGLGATSKAIDVKRPRYNEMLSNMDVVRIATGGMHVVALTKDNQIVTWGVNDNAALGRDTSNAEIKMKDMDADDSDSDSDDSTGGLNNLEATPMAISPEHFPPDTVFVDVAAGDSCSFALTTEGALYGWGTFRKNEGVLGFTKGVNTAHTPMYIDSLKKITKVVCGTNHVLALDKDGHVWAWGNGQQNQLGRRVIERNLIESLLPNRVGFTDKSAKRPSKKMVDIACGDYHSFAIGEDGHVWGWGANSSCETGITENVGEDAATLAAPRIVHSLEPYKVVSIAGGAHHNMAVTDDGKLLAWGRCEDKQTGLSLDDLNKIDDDSKLLKKSYARPDGTPLYKPSILLEPTRVPNVQDIILAACGPDHTLAVDKFGKAFSWGFSINYQTGQGPTDDIETPTLLANTAVREEKIVWAGAGGQYSMLASKKGSS
ncbi:RCC1/BLIP-II [Sporormia fimetaria CBS 119925]|uniref:RCC1/BLIP-II n=1 Tax=Sporormia fimetaria CBS 119925 TaxID=1340428 RepID=A0A6A6V7Y1_9PLEO|nr:RCC1/BLIP-II [Sporormia fimetaria CBS 119925]